MDNTKLLDCKNLRISFRTINGTVKAVRGIDFSLYRGKTLAIVGESGSGKSVTSRAVMGILASNKIVEDGEILYGDKDLLQISEEEFCKLRGSKISMIFQDPLSSLNPIKKVGAQVMESMKLKRASARKEARADFEASYKIYKTFLADHQGLTYTLDDLDAAVAMFQNKDTSVEAFKLKKFDRITNDNLVTFNKTIEATVNEEKKKSLVAQRDAFAVERKAGHDELQKKLDERIQGLEESHTDYTKFDLSGLVSVTNEMFVEYHKDLIGRYQKNFVLLDQKFGEFSSLNGDDFIETLTRNIDAMGTIVLDCRNDLALEKDELVFTFSVSLKHLVKEFYKLKKYEARQAKLALKNEKKTGNAGPKEMTSKQKAWSSEIDISSVSIVQKIKDQIRSTIDTLEKDYIGRLADEMKPENTAKKAEEYVKVFTSNIVTFSHKTRNEEIMERVIELLGLVGIPEPQKRIKQYPFEFSGGMRQRIVIAIALSSNPEILICDEPTTALDVTIQAQILELINDLKKKLDLSIIFITHNLGVVANMADDIAVMYAGKIVEYGTVDEIFYEPKHPYTWALLASMPDLETKSRLDAIPGAPPNMIIPPKGDAFAPRNKYAMKIDFEEEPPHFYVSPTHWAATWLLAEGAPKVDPPAIVTERIERNKKRYMSGKAEKE